MSDEPDLADVVSDTGPRFDPDCETCEGVVCECDRRELETDANATDGQNGPAKGKTSADPGGSP